MSTFFVYVILSASYMISLGRREIAVQSSRYFAKVRQVSVSSTREVPDLNRLPTSVIHRVFSYVTYIFKLAVRQNRSRPPVSPPPWVLSLSLSPSTRFTWSAVDLTSCPDKGSLGSDSSSPESSASSPGRLRFWPFSPAPGVGSSPFRWCNCTDTPQLSA
jgi:hypothetical protein